MESRSINIESLEQNIGQVEGLPGNPRQWTRTDLDKLKRSIEETPELLEARGLIVYPYDDQYIVIGGNMRLAALREMGAKDAPCIVLPEDTTIDKLKELVIKDNGAFGQNDWDALANEWSDLPLSEWGISAWFESPDASTSPSDEDEIARKEREFKERMEAGEISEEDEEYQEFLEKFKLKKTTDDCYTPPVVYDAVADWVAKEYGLNKAKFVRPFYPGGDYQKEEYAKDAVVVDNPPFSIMSEILNFYNDNGIKFFLFAPHLTLFSSSSLCTALPCGCGVVYENGASVNTSFLTNLEDKKWRVHSAPTLHKAVREANEKNLKERHKELPKYSYDHHIITSTFIGQLSRLGIDFRIPVAESESISQLESQKESGKTIFGKGYIVSDRVFAEREKADRVFAEREKAEREKAEREKAEREKAERWELSPKELAIVDRLNKNA